MKYDLTDDGHNRIATFDIETTDFDASTGETVSIGIGLHERGTHARDAEYELFHRGPSVDESELIQQAFEHLDSLEVGTLVSYNGIGFDFKFLHDRLEILGEDSPSAQIGNHVDLFAPRKQLAENRNESWPSLEACLDAYDIDPAKTFWRGESVDNTRFGEELGPAVLESAKSGDEDTYYSLQEVVNHYLLSDLEANLALFHADVGAEFEPEYLGTEAKFEG